MSGVHDLGGRDGFGPVVAEVDEPVFHEDWERRVFAINIAAGGALGPLDYRRHGIERMPPDDYLRASYYEKWLARVELLAVELGLVTPDELKSGRLQGQPIAEPPTPESIEAVIRRGRPADRPGTQVKPQFRVGDRVRVRQVEPRGHTRLPRYVRGHVGHVHALHGIHVFPDSNAHGRGEMPQPLYSIEFEAVELWGPTARSCDRLYIDLWETYLEPRDEDKG